MLDLSGTVTSPRNLAIANAEEAGSSVHFTDILTAAMPRGRAPRAGPVRIGRVLCDR